VIRSHDTPGYTGVAERCAAGSPNPPRGHVNADAVQRREVDDDAPVTHRVARNIVAAPTYGDQKVMPAREIDGVDDIGNP